MLFEKYHFERCYNKDGRIRH